MQELVIFYNKDRISKLKEYSLKETSLGKTLLGERKEETRCLEKIADDTLVFYAPTKLNPNLNAELVSTLPFEVTQIAGEIRISHFNLRDETQVSSLYELLEHLKTEQKQNFKKNEPEICSSINSTLLDYMQLTKHLSHLKEIQIKECSFQDFPPELNKLLSKQKKFWDKEKEKYVSRIEDLANRLKEEYSISDVSFHRDISSDDYSYYPEAKVVGKEISDCSRKEMIKKVVEEFKRYFS